MMTLGKHNTNSQIKFKTMKLKTSLWDYSDIYILVKRTISNANTAVQAADAKNNDKQVSFNNCAPFNDCISKINNTQKDNAKDTDVVMPIYNLIEYSDNYLKTSGTLWQYYRDEPPLDNAGAIGNFVIVLHLNSNKK